MGKETETNFDRKEKPRKNPNPKRREKRKDGVEDRLPWVAHHRHHPVVEGERTRRGAGLDPPPPRGKNDQATTTTAIVRERPAAVRKDGLMLRARDKRAPSRGRSIVERSPMGERTR
ncbi:hypothetical protein PR202_ga30048 [Eleusine coracana subsp. coracana]|uniref:Uncharacterized protein n=1 Tax=Eleusine coracana subsp. coracana TaxID=191504 RepID=A0AAV5DMW8_ELECO|nr:hypothetical protein PR202_ga30048 [Eleusine coracana subsp. coracana]